jgi:hypothetical protein
MKTSLTVAEAIVETLISPNEADRNMEAANVVDALFAIARGLNAIAVSIEAVVTEMEAQRNAPGGK